MTPNRFPQFYLIGAPKCGTTALYKYLSEHPGVFMPELKEPHYFSSDFVRYKRVQNKEDYLQLFSQAPANSVTGEGSVWYLYSQIAVAEILKERPDAKFVVMLRNPVDAAEALHAEQLLSLTEDVQDLGQAWALQALRAGGERLPVHCHEPLHLQYSAIYSYADQVGRLLRQAPASQVKILIHEEFFADPETSYRDLQSFLSLSLVDRASFERINGRRAPRNMMLQKLFSRPPGFLRPAFRFVADLSHRRGLKLGRLVTQLMRVERTERRPLPPALRSELEAAFAADIAQLENLLGRPLSVWRAKPAP